MVSRTSTDGCSPLYVGDIEIHIEDMDASTHSFDHDEEDLVAAQKEPRSTSTSPLEFHEVDPRKDEEEEVNLPELHFLAWPLKMSEFKIKEALHTLHVTHALMTNFCWNF